MNCRKCTLIGSATQKKYVNTRNKNVKVEIIGRKQNMYENTKAKHTQAHFNTFLQQVLYHVCSPFTCVWFLQHPQ